MAIHKFKHFGTDGVRGVVGEKFCADFVVKCAQAIFGACQPKKVVVGCDTRTSCDYIVSLLSGVLASYGVQVVCVGIVPSAGLAYITANLDADLGIMVTASHNESCYNGIKLFSRTGEKLSDDIVKKIDMQIGVRQNFAGARSENVGRISYDLQAIKAWQDFLVSTFLPFFDGKECQLNKKIAIDCAHGSGAECAEAVLRRLGFNIEAYNTTQIGHNINEKCGATDLSFLSDVMRRKKFDIGFAFDGDADRVVVCDGNGEVVSGDIIMYLIATYLKRIGKLSGDAFVSTVMFNIGVERALNEDGIKLVRTDVGDRFVARGMQQGGYNMGGEPSGHIIFRDVFVAGDGLLSALMVLVALYNKELCECIRGVAVYPESSTRIRADEGQKRKLFASKEFRKFIKSIKSDNKQCHIVVRASGTEAIIRVSVQAPCQDYAQKLCAQIRDIIVKIIGT